MSKSGQSLGAADDGETLGQLQRPSGGFTVADGFRTLPTVGPISEDERRPSASDELWLVAKGPPEPTAWLRDAPERPRSGLLAGFRELHRGTDQAIARFASRHGWLTTRTLLVSVEPSLSEEGWVGPADPVWGDRVSTWKRESRDMDELWRLLECARRLREAGNDEHARQPILAHFQSSPGGATLWVGPQEWLTKDLWATPGADQTPADTWSKPGPWHVAPVDKTMQFVPDPGIPSAQTLGFVYRGGEEVLYLRMPIHGGPVWGSRLEWAGQVSGSALGALARHAALAATQKVIRSETCAVLTDATGIRVAPVSLLGALYLNFARELFERPRQKLCRGCVPPMYFTPRRPNQRWCSDPCKSRGRRKGLSRPTSGKGKDPATGGERRTGSAT